MWGEYADEIVEDYLEAYGLLIEDLELLKSAYREDNKNCECNNIMYLSWTISSNSFGHFIKW